MSLNVVCFHLYFSSDAARFHCQSYDGRTRRADPLAGKLSAPFKQQSSRPALVHLTAGQVEGPVRLSVQRSLNQRIAQNKLRRKLCCTCPPLPTLPFLSSWLLIRDCTKFQTKLALGKFLPRGKHFCLNLPLHLIKSSLNPTEEQVNDIFSNKPTRFKHQPH